MDILKAIEGSFTFQLIAGIVAAIIIGFKVLEQFRKGLDSDPPPKPGSAVVEMATISDVTPWRDIAAQTKRSADALEKIAQSLSAMNKRQQLDDEREEKEAMRRLIDDLQRQIAALIIPQK